MPPGVQSVARVTAVPSVWGALSWSRHYLGGLTVRGNTTKTFDWRGQNGDILNGLGLSGRDVIC